MCGRYNVDPTDLDAIEERFELEFVDPDAPLGPRFNLAPTQYAPIARVANDRVELVGMKWGLIPSWAKDPAIGNKMINARSEGIADKPSFRAAFKRRRCLVPANGFFEWIQPKNAGGGKAKKQPLRFVRPSREHFAFAGLWETWRHPETEQSVLSFTIVTRAATDWMKPYHHRMPVILPTRKLERQWLDPELEGAAVAAACLESTPPELETYTVHPAVNSPNNDTPEMIKPWSPPEQTDLFAE